MNETDWTWTSADWSDLCFPFLPRKDSSNERKRVGELNSFTWWNCKKRRRKRKRATEPEQRIKGDERKTKRKERRNETQDESELEGKTKRSKKKWEWTGSQSSTLDSFFLWSSLFLLSLSLPFLLLIHQVNPEDSWSLTVSQSSTFFLWSSLFLLSFSISSFIPF